MRNQILFVVNCFIGAVLWGPAALAVVMPRYEASPVGVLPAGATTLFPNDINDFGLVVGSVDVSPSLHPFRSQNGVVEVLEPLAGGLYAFASAVNNLGEVVGTSSIAGIPKGAFWPTGDSEPQELDTSGGPDANVYPTGVNESREISGYFTGSGSGNVNSWTGVRWYWDEDRFREDELSGPVPPPPGVPTEAFDINDLGQIVGAGSTQQAGVFQAALRWSATNQVQELDAPAGLFFARMEAVAINNTETAVGHTTDTFGNSTALRWDANRDFTDLGRPLGATSVRLADLNETEMIIGNGVFADGNRGVANYEGQWVDLNSRLVQSPGWTIQFVTAINDVGQIVGSGVLNGVATGFILNPVEELGPGDFDLDGDVDGRDFLIWQRGGSPDPLSAADLSLWQENYGQPLPAATSIPEPGAFALCLAALAVSTGWRHH